MSEEQPRAELPDNWRAEFAFITGAVEAIRWPKVGDRVRDARKTAQQMSLGLVERLTGLEAYPDLHTFHDAPYGDGVLRVAVTPPDALYQHQGAPYWRITTNIGRSVYVNGRAREQWDLSDVLIQPEKFRFGERWVRLAYTLGHSEVDPPRGMPPRIVRDSQSAQYSLRHAPGYELTLPEVPMIGGEDKLTYFQTYSRNVSSLLHLLGYLSDATRVEAAPDLEQDNGP
jgi:hypothetical protein